jgi:hypothetical protein
MACSTTETTGSVTLPTPGTLSAGVPAGTSTVMVSVRPLWYVTVTSRCSAEAGNTAALKHPAKMPETTKPMSSLRLVIRTAYLLPRAASSNADLARRA